MGSLKDKIRAAEDMKCELIDVPEWGVKVQVGTMTAQARAKMLRMAMRDDNSLDYEILYPAVLMACCTDPEDGTPLFDEADADWLSAKSAGPIERLAQVGMRLSGLDENAVDLGKGAS